MADASTRNESAGISRGLGLIERLRLLTRGKRVKAGETLYKAGDTASEVYRIASGSVAVFAATDEPGLPEMIQVANRGDYVGLGCLGERIETAIAVTDTVVLCMPYSEFAQVIEREPQWREKQAAQLSRELEHRKRVLSKGSAATPLERLAAFLVAVSRHNAYEGRDVAVISDTLTCGVVTSMIDLDISTLSETLQGMARKGLVEQMPTGELRLKDIPALEMIADAHVELPKKFGEELWSRLDRKPPAPAPDQNVRAGKEGDSAVPGEAPRLGRGVKLCLAIGMTAALGMTMPGGMRSDPATPDNAERQSAVERVLERANARYRAADEALDIAIGWIERAGQAYRRLIVARLAAERTRPVPDSIHPASPTHASAVVVTDTSGPDAPASGAERRNAR